MAYEDEIPPPALFGDGQTFALSVINDPAYQRMLYIRARAGVLDASLEKALWHYAFGKPVDKREVKHTFDFKTMPKTDVEQRALAAAQRVQHLLEGHTLAQGAIEATAVGAAERAPEPLAPEGVHFTDFAGGNRSEVH